MIRSSKRNPTDFTSHLKRFFSVLWPTTRILQPLLALSTRHTNEPLSAPARECLLSKKTGNWICIFISGQKYLCGCVRPGPPFYPQLKLTVHAVCVCVLAVCICSANWLLSNFVYVCVYECCDDDVRAWKGDIKHDSVAIFRLWKEAISVIDII